MSVTRQCSKITLILILLLKKEQQSKVKGIPEHDGLRRNWLIIQKQSALSLQGELKAHFGTLAKSKRETAQRLYTQLGESILKNKDVSTTEQKRLLKLLEDADQRVGESLQPYIRESQERLEKKLTKLRDSLKQAPLAPSVQEMEGESQGDRPHPGPKNQEAPITKENLLQAMRDLFGTSTRDGGTHREYHLRFHPYRGRPRGGRGRGGYRGRGY